MNDYHIEVDTDVSDKLGEDPTTRYHYVLRAAKPHCWSSNEKILSPLRYELTLLTDGTTLWATMPQQKRYLQQAGGEKTDERELLLEHHFRYVRRFELLDGKVRARHERTAAVGRGPASVTCDVLRLEPLGDEGWSELLWVDPVRKLILKSEHTERRSGNTIRTRTAWKIIAIDAESATRLFQFTPPDGWRRTNALVLR
jgi:hypothetical protein